VPVAFEVAAALDAPLDVIVVRKLGVPPQPELGMGAIGEGGVRVIDRDVMAHAGVSDSQLQSVERQKRSVLEARVAQLRCGRERTPLDGRAAVIVGRPPNRSSRSAITTGTSRRRATRR